MTSEISVPFRIGGDGRIATVDDPDAQVRLHVLALVNTTPQERVTVPGYGVDLNSLIFEDMDGAEAATQAGVLVQDAFAAWEPGVRLDTVEVDEDDSVESAGVLNVLYSRLDAADSGTAVNANSAIISASGTVREVVRG